MAKRLASKKKKYTLYLGVDQMGLAAKLADVSGKSVSSLVGEALHGLFAQLGLEVEPPEITSNPEMLRQRANQLKASLSRR